jgi:hypothetical protein
LFVFPAVTLDIPAVTLDIPAVTLVIPANAGIHVPLFVIPGERLAR